MVKKVTLEEILNGYPEIRNVSELLDSDILVLPLHQDGSFSLGQFLGIENDGLKIKYYSNGKPAYRFYASAPSLDTIINLGILIVTSITGLVAIADSIKENHKGEAIHITINVYVGNNSYISNTYEGDGDDVGEEILDLREHVR